MFVTDIHSQKVVSTGNLSGSIGIGSSQDLLNKLVDLEHEKAKINNQRAKFILEKAEKILSNTGLQAINLIHKTGFLVDCFYEFYVDDHSIHLLVMGAYGHSRIRHLVIGSTTAQMLRASDIPVLLYR